VAAIRANAADHPLSDDADNRRGYQEGLDLQVKETGEHTADIIGMDRRQHQVPGQGCLGSYVGRLGIAYLADQYHIRVKTEYGPQAAGKGNAGLVVDLNLVDILNRYSAGSSMVMMFLPMVSRELIAAYRVVVLPAPVGPLTRIMP
jgi:hypothetical protein